MPETSGNQSLVLKCKNEAVLENTHTFRVQLRGGSVRAQESTVSLSRQGKHEGDTNARQGGAERLKKKKHRGWRWFLDTHWLRRDFHQELRLWGPDQHHYKLQLINVYHTYMKEKHRRDGGRWIKRRAVRGHNSHGCSLWPGVDHTHTHTKKKNVNQGTDISNS